MTKPFKIPCVILCGGKSSRMGEDKALLPFAHSNTLAQYQFDRLKAFFKDIYISSKTNKFEFLKEENLILDRNEIYSPIVALKTIFDTIKDEKVFIITVDTPLVSFESISELIDNSINSDICVAQTLRTHNLCGVFSSKLNKACDEMIKKDIHKVGFLLKNNNTKIVELPNDHEFINLNNKDEYKKALSLINKTYN